VRAGISFALAEAMDDGHCGLPHEELLALTRELHERIALVTKGSEIVANRLVQTPR
jgi:hypothetical protein